MNYETMVNLVRITERTTGRVWVRFDDALPFFRISWAWAPWGPWWGWN
jgi:hypothetical protein